MTTVIEVVFENGVFRPLVEADFMNTQGSMPRWMKIDWEVTDSMGARYIVRVSYISAALMTKDESSNFENTKWLKRKNN